MATISIDHRRAQTGQDPSREGGPALVSAATTSGPSHSVTVNGTVISRKAIAAEAQNFPADNPGEAWRAATRALVIRELLLQEASRLEVPIEQIQDEKGRRETEEDALTRALIEREVRLPEADDETLRRYYDNNRRRFTSAPLYEADHILLAARGDDRESFVSARQRAATLAATLKDHPERFAVLAREHSACPSAAMGGNLGQIGPGDTTPPFEAALAKLDCDEISEPVETRYGVHLIRLRQRFDGEQLPFEAVRDRIATYLTERSHRQAVAQYLSILVGKAEIKGIELNGATSPLVR